MTIVTVAKLKKMLPKTYLHKKETLAEIIAVMSQNKHLEPVMDRFVYNDGTGKNLMSLQGTIAVLYKGKHYNFPVCLWLEESYPRSPPICFVKPTREMVIVPCKYVDNDGKILLPYLDEWRHTQCDLHGLIQVMMAVFGEIPPLCVRTRPEDNCEYMLKYPFLSCF
ncbi:tumor susceptibility gene 101 protein [Chanos chanos]|uniref:Tumor susceptibility gene 101 protein n=1 Tax=Chanos chanos TaxID=29144 RepID=A0A6J2WRN2_CHACN|nr:tumor susceptibility gene 101 protein-like [Chanos chanos]